MTTLRSRYNMPTVVSQVETWALLSEDVCKRRQCQSFRHDATRVIGVLVSLLLRTITVDDAVARLHCFGWPRGGK